MEKKIIFIGLLTFICLSGILLWSCGPKVVYVRPPEPRVEVYGTPPYPEAVWIPGYWRHKRGAWVWVPGHWERRPQPHAIWVPGHWEPKGPGWIWIPGHWEYR